MSSEQTAAAEGKIGDIRRDPMAMLPFCGYNMGDYWQHWIDFRKRLGYGCPKIFYVNWFRKDPEVPGFLWPGFGENCRVLKWITERVDGFGEARATPIGYVPTPDALELGGLDLKASTMKKLLHVDSDSWLEETRHIKEYFDKFERLPPILADNLEKLKNRLKHQSEAPTTNHALSEWVAESARLCEPDNIHWCTGSIDEYNKLCGELVDAGTFIGLNEDIRPNSYLARTNPDDVGRVDDVTFVCGDKKTMGANNQWADPEEMEQKMQGKFAGAMKGRTMYVIPYCMGPLGSKYSRFGVQITDSPYVVVSMRQVVRVGSEVLTLLGSREWFLPTLHSVGSPLANGQPDVPWPCNPAETVIALFTEKDKEKIYSYGSGFGANSIVTKRLFGLRMGSQLARNQGWFAEHLSIISVTTPQNEKSYIAFGSATGGGKTTLATSPPKVPGYTIRMVGDDVAWVHADDGQMYAINPDYGTFDRCSGVSYHNSRGVMEMVARDTIFVNTGLTKDGDVWWEGLTEEVPEGVLDWQGQPYTGDGVVAHRNARYSAAFARNPMMDPNWDTPSGVPISAFVYGSKRSKVVPLLTEARSWEEGVFLGSLLSVEHSLEDIRREPFAMVPYVTYNLSRYLSKWLALPQQLGYTAPKFFLSNMFRTNEEGEFLWPGFGHNIRLIRWILGRLKNEGEVEASPLGLLPPTDALNPRAMGVDRKTIEAALAVDPAEWAEEIVSIEKFFAAYPDMPSEIKRHLASLKAALQK